MAALIVAVATASPALAQQTPDAKADVRVARPMWQAGAGPVVAIDEGHRNFHTLGGRYAPFAALLRNDGLKVVAAEGTITAESLAGVAVLVVANARAAEADGSAFTAGEIAVLKAWVEDGGALLLIADHAPFAGAASELAGAFGFTFADAYAQTPREGPPPDIFKGALLGDHVIVRGRSGDEAVDRVGTFTGSAFRAPAGATPILILPNGTVLLPEKPGGGADLAGVGRDGSGALQGAVMTLGKGRVAVFGEAAMFSAQIAGASEVRAGFNSPAAPRNRQFTTNMLRWLAGALPD